MSTKTNQSKKLTVIITSYNEEENIESCLRSVMWADEIFVVDSFSTDQTLGIARKYTDRIVQHEYTNPAAQKKLKIDIIQSIMRLLKISVECG
jgi:glycosyltransferase involved in cell wall biosynthesis